MITVNLQKVRKNIDNALKSRAESKLTGYSVQLVAVTKTHPADVVKEALASGLTVFGENKVQEAEGKISLVGDGEWHLIGHLQTNKVKKAVSLFSMIYSVDSIKLLEAVNKAAKAEGKVQNILLQVNIAEEKSKFGLDEKALKAAAKHVDMLENVLLRGLMVIAPEVENPEDVRPVFKKGYECFCELRNLGIKNGVIDTLSMGMSGDYEIAVQEGANNIRLGSVLFGPRDYSI